MAIAGLSVVGREKYGVFPLKGKLLNVLDIQINKLQVMKKLQI
jgi:DNA topoisomerase-2